MEYEAFGRGKLGGKRVKGDGFVAGVFVGDNGVGLIGESGVVASECPTLI